MDQERFLRLEQILEAVWQASPEDRTRVLIELCADDGELQHEAERLLGLEEEDGFLEGPPLEALGSPDSSDRLGPNDSEASTLQAGRPRRSESEEAGARIGSYEIVSPLGRGGMGTVYLARRHDGVHDQKVALKILATALHDSSVRERFSAERRILGHLSHPNIASLLDGGTTSDDRPYLVMEWVDGVPIDRHCREQKLSLRERLVLFQKVCAAVQEAHRSLIVHRDLKPANILVDSRGEPKLLDFGIAKLLGSNQGAESLLSQSLVVTAPGSQPMTPAYASPEQVKGGAITTAVDVYALGIVLHELLTGRRPYDLAGVHLAEAIHRICEVVPPKPSTRVRQSLSGAASDTEERSEVDLRLLEKQLAGDLDAIVGRALRKEPEHRYASAESLRDDVERYLEARPVKAAEGTWSYRVGKFIRRHRAAVAASAAALALIVGFTLVLLLQGQRVREERNRAEFTSDFLLDLFIGVDPWSVESRDPSAADMLDRGRRALEARDLAPEDRADLLHAIGAAYAGIGRFDEAEGLLGRALQTKIELHGKEHGEVAESMTQLAHVMRWQGEVAAGLEMASRARRIYGLLGMAESREAVIADAHLADYLDILGRYDEAEQTFLNAVATAEKRGYPDLEAVLLQRLGMAKRRLRLYDESLEALERSLAAHVTTYGREHPRTAETLTELGTVKLAIGEIPAARDYFAEAEKIQRQLLGDDHPETQRVLTRQSQLALALGDHQRAEELLMGAESLLSEQLGPHTFVADALRLQSTLLLEAGKPAEAERAAREALDIFESLVGVRHVETADARHKLALALAAQAGRVGEARGLIEESLAMMEELTGEGSPRTVLVLADAGWIEVLAGDLEQAEVKLGKAIEGFERFYGQRHLDLAKVHNNLAIVKHSQGALAEAEHEYRKAVDMARETLGVEAPFFGALHTNLARLLVSREKLTEAEEVLASGAQVFERAGLGRWHVWRLHADRVRAKIWLRQKRHRQVDALLQPWLAHFDGESELSANDRFYAFSLAASNLEAWGRSDAAAEVRRRLASR